METNENECCEDFDDDLETSEPSEDWLGEPFEW
jgi:hypothetical protein